MKKIILLVLIVTYPFLVGFTNSASRKVDKGNRKFEDGKFEEALAFYEEAKEKLPESAIPDYNLGNAYYQQQNFEQALQAYDNAFIKANDALKADIYHNKGNALLKTAQIDKAIQAYKDALKINPKLVDTKYNLEIAYYLKEQQEKNQQQDNPEKQEPSEFAKQLKEQAEELILQGKYREAHNLMQDGIKKDATIISHYGKFIERLSKVVGSEE